MLLLLFKLLEKKESGGVAVMATVATDNVSEREAERGRPPPWPGTADEEGTLHSCPLLPASLQVSASVSPAVQAA